MAFGEKSRYKSTLSSRVLAAALSIAPDVLKVDQLGTFALAYIKGQSAADLALFLRTSPLAVTRRLQRISRKVQLALMESLHELLPVRSRAPLMKVSLTGTGRKRFREIISRSDDTLCEDLLMALNLLIHSEPGDTTS